MPRYYDMDKLVKMIEAKVDTLIDGKEAFLYVAKWLDLLPAADVVSRERYDGVMDNLKSVLAERAEEKSEVAREIFAEIEEEAYYMATAYGEEVKVISYDDLAELKKKYTGGTE